MRDWKRELLSLWLHEMEGNCSSAWRDYLSREELYLVDRWDQKYSAGAYQVCLDILRAEQQFLQGNAERE